MANGGSSSSSGHHGKTSSSTAGDRDYENRREQRRQNNIKSAQRSRERLKNQQNWMAVQMSENEDRMKHLEKRVVELTEELTAPPRKQRPTHRSSRGGAADAERPQWFGTPF